MTRTNFIRNILVKNIDLPAYEVIRRLGKRGIEVSQQLVYQTRCVMKKHRCADRIPMPQSERQAEGVRRSAQVRRVNLFSLRQHILFALVDGKPRTCRQITELVRASGYLTSADLLAEVRKKLPRLVLERIAQKVGWKDDDQAERGSYSYKLTSAGMAVAIEEIADRKTIEETAAQEKAMSDQFINVTDRQEPVTPPQQAIDPLQALLEVRTLAQKLGGLEKLEQYIQSLRQLGVQ